MNQFSKEKYYIPTRLDRYINYKNITNLSNDKIIRNVNCNLDYDYYSHNNKADTSLNNLILVNKYYYLDNDYIPDNLVYIDNKYSLRGCLKKEVCDSFTNMARDALDENLVLINGSSYRSSKRQQEIYDESFKDIGYKADKTIARPGYSEHQTGLCLDIRTRDKDIEDFYDTKEYLWVKDNAYKYGFILRYPYGKEDLTGYSFEPWHYRYVGAKIAKYIYENDITFDEYYAFYIEKKS